METQCIYSDVGNYFMCYLDELQASQFEQNLSNFDWVIPTYCCTSLSSSKEISKTLLSFALKFVLCTRTFSVHCLSGKTIAGPQLRAIRSHPFTSEWQLSEVVTSQVLTVRQETHSTDPFKIPSLMDERSLPQKSLRFVCPVSVRQRKWLSRWLIPIMKGHNMQYSQCTIGCKGSRRTPANLEHEVIEEVPTLGMWSWSTVESCPHKNARIVYNQQTTRRGVCWSALVIRSIDSYSDSQGYHLIPKTVYRTTWTERQ
jgi:hypothetical protein